MALREKKIEKVVIRSGRRKRVNHIPHGGWKVAYADFVTAMMAFFLLMWLVSATDKDQKDAISEYFNPYQAEDDSSSVDVSAGIISIMDGGQMGGKQIEDREVADSQGNPDAVAQAEDVEGENTFASPLEYWDVVEITREEYENLKERADQGLQGSHFEQEFEALAADLKSLKSTEPLLKKYEDQIIIEEVYEGLRIQFIDQEKFSMFRSASADLSDAALEMIATFGLVLKELPNGIAIAGHTDSVPFTSRTGYSNWELSSDRANAARRAILASGVRPDQLTSIEGKADTDPLYPDAPTDARNRRIEFMILR